MVFACAFELLHAGLVLLIVRPFIDAYNIVLSTIPQMIIAVSLGMGISIIIIHSIKESGRPVSGIKNHSFCSTEIPWGE